jgi:hypothetical protein
MLACGLGLVVLTSGCAAIVPPKAPSCVEEQTAGMLIIEAQSVPTAALVPCVGALPIGWSFETFQVDDNGTTFYLDSDRAGAQAVRVDLRRSCDLGDATEVPTDTPGARQFEKIDALGDRYAGTRFYVFEGGCVTYNFDFEGSGRTELAREVSLALDFFSRAELERRLAEVGRDL